MESSAPSNLPLRMRKEVALSILRRSRPRGGEDMRVFVMGAAAGGEGICRLWQSSTRGGMVCRSCSVI